MVEVMEHLEMNASQSNKKKTKKVTESLQLPL